VIKPIVLILANLHDFSSDKVCLALAQKNVTYLRLNRDQLSELRLCLDPIEPRLKVEYKDQTWIVDETLRSVWFRQPTYLRNAEGRILTATEQLYRSQWMAFIRALSVFENALWINDPAATFRAENKAWQLRIASVVGFDVPKTLISNDPNTPVPETIGDPFALKALDTVLLREGETQAFAFTQIVSWLTCNGDDFQKIPSTLQTALHDKLDLRVTIVGEQFWCVAILRNAHGVDGDWRLHKKGELSYEPYELPDVVVNRCFMIMRQMGLVMAGIDLAFSEQRYWFIEINPTGEWGWLESPIRPIASTISSVLSC
jgi:hypothetical protein